MRVGVAFLAAVLLGAGCGGSGGSGSPNACAEGAGLDPDECLLPWPSSAFLVADASTRTGWRVQIPARFMPINEQDQAIDPAPWNRWDGFSPMATLIAQLGAVIDTAPLPRWQDAGASLLPDSPTVIIDVDSGARVAHFAEIEASPEVAAGRTTLYIRPAARLGEGRHYVVAIRGLRGKDGVPVPASEPFAELRDDKASSLSGRRAAFERDVFAPLAKAGIARAGLILAWDFRTGSGQTAWGDLVAERDIAVAAAGAGGLGCTVTKVTEDPSDTVILRSIEGTFTVPSFLEAGAGGALRIARDATGRPVIKGNAEAPFRALIPRSAADRAAGGGRAPVWIYGHGLFSDPGEILRDSTRDTASQGGAIVAATLYAGMSSGDLELVTQAVFDMNKFPQIIDQVQQGVINTVLLPRTVAGKCAENPAFQIGGRALPDPADFGYFGNSMGGTMGSTVAALSPDMQRYALGVGAMNFPVMMPRTKRWTELEGFFRLGYPRRIERDLLMVMSAEEWERGESSAFGPHVLRDPLPGSRPARVLMQIGLHDSDVTNVAQWMAARTLGLPQLSPAAYQVWGLPPMAAPLDSAFVLYDLGAAALPDNNLPPAAENIVHEGVRIDPRAQAQIVAFLRPGGQVTDTCGGACGPRR